MEVVEGPAGPCISGIWDLGSPDQPVREGMLVEDMSIPGCFANLSSTMLPLGVPLWGDNTYPSAELLQALRMLQR